MGNSPYELVDSYQKMSWNSANEAMEDCGKWCKDLFFILPNPQSHCCWYGKGKASGMGFEICSLSNAPMMEEMNQQVFIDQGADEMEGYGAWILKPEEVEEEGAMNGLSLAIAASSALLMMVLN